MPTWTLQHAFNSVDHKALWWWLWEFNVCQTLRAHYEADLPYEKTALTWHKAGRQTVSIAFLPYLERPLFGVEGSGYRSQDRYWPAGRGFADGLVLVDGSCAGMQHRFGVVANFCEWPWTSVKLEKSVITASGLPLVATVKKRLHA